MTDGEVIVVGGYGVFGRLVAEDLARRGHRLVIAGRRRDQAERQARALGDRCRAMEADVTDADACRALVRDAQVVASCAGPFSALGTTLVEACADAGCHYADIADDRAFVRQVRALGSRFADRGRVAAFGCSSLPAVSGALAFGLRTEHGPAARARMTLFIGNDNPKGEAAVRSAVSLLGRPIETPQGTVLGFRDGEVVELPPPFGRRRVYNFETADLDVLPAVLGASALSVKVGFEMRVATAGFAMLAVLGSRWGDRTARWATRLGALGRGVGCSGGVTMAELWRQDGTRVWAAISSASGGQRMAALPCAYVVDALVRGTALPVSGARAAYEVIEPEALLARLVADGFTLSKG